VRPWFLRHEARLSAEAFLATYAERFTARRIRIGCSFAPEQFGATPDDPARRYSALAALRAAVEDVGMANVRLGLRWSHLCPVGEVFSGFYAPYLEYCFASSGVREVCLDIGPIKTFRWPEVHVPQAVLAGLAHVPARGAVIDPGTALGDRALAHAQRTLDYLGTEFGNSKPVTFCFNEPLHPFGPRGWTMSERYLEQLIVLIRASAFSNARFLVSSSEGADLARIAQFFASQTARDPGLRAKLISGYNYYPFTPPPLTVPVLGECVSALRRWKHSPRHSAGANRSRANDPHTGYSVEVSEAQCEPWGREQRAGNSLALWQHVLAECIEQILVPEQPESVIRMWGIEHQLQMAMTVSGEQNRAILRLTGAINALGGHEPHAAGFPGNQVYP
jgi:hypothetical protein